jgi:hypothetical protein
MYLFDQNTEAGLWKVDSGHLAFGTTNSERMRIDSSGNVGIGTSSPSTKVEISGTGFQTLSVTSTNSSPVLKLNSAASSVAYLQWNNAGSSPLSFYDLTASSERMRIDSSGRVGIGTSSPQGKFNVSDNGGYGFEFFPNDASKNHFISYDRGAAVYRDYKISASQIIFGYGQSGSNEAMRIDSSGRLLVGKTSFGLASDGVQLGSTNSAFTASNNIPVYVNRNTNHGGLIDFQKDGTTVGSIDSSFGNLLIRGAGNISGLRFDTNSFTPFKNGSEANGTVDLGYANGRFKDLYLSGGVYLGGTGSANKLDDYEEGTFTPSWTNASSATYNTQIGKYTKIGNVVFYYIRLDSSSLTFTSAPAIQGLPFTSNNTANLYSNAYTFPTIGFEYFGDGGIIGQVPFNDTKVQLYYLTNGTGGNYNVVDASSMSEGTQVVINVSGHYYI